MAPGTERRSVALHAVKTLQDLAICLEARIYFYHDAAFYSPKQGKGLMIEGVTCLGFIVITIEALTLALLLLLLVSCLF